MGKLVGVGATKKVDSKEVIELKAQIAELTIATEELKQTNTDCLKENESLKAQIAELTKKSEESKKNKDKDKE